MQLGVLNRVLKLRYSFFDIPFVLAGGLLGGLASGWPQVTDWLWICIAMVLARTAGMAFNEVIDRWIDALNPRTMGRAIPSGEVRASWVMGVGLVASGLFCLCGACINTMTAVCGPILIGMIAVYAYLKRITPLCHFFLGLILACGPVMAAIVVSGQLVPGVVWLGIAFFASITANDIFYGSQDFTFDQAHSVHSLPAWLGIHRAWQVASVLHALCVVALIGVGYAVHLGPLYFVGLSAMAVYLIVHHVRIRKGADLQTAFLWCNKVVGIGSFVSILGGILWRG